MRGRSQLVAMVIVLIVAVVAPATARVETAVDVPGVSSRTIKIGVHAPMTGAVPLPNESLERAARLYWEWRKQRGRAIHGRNVEVVIRNDNYNPTQALSVCRRLVEVEHVFMLVGVYSGVDQMQTCARYASRVGVPYLSLGMTKVGLRNQRTYFALTMPWARQARMMADHLVRDLGGRREKNAVVSFDSPNHIGSYNAFNDRMDQRRAPVDYARRVCHCSTTTEAQQVVAELKALEIENVYVVASPTWFLQLLQAARSQDYHPQWLGTTMGGIAPRESILRVGCRNGTAGGTRFLTPFPALADRDRFDERFERAVRRVYPGAEPDDVMWSGWAASKGIARLLARPGRELTRRRFVASTSRARGIRTGVLPMIGFAPDDHFADREIHVIRANCRKQNWSTVRSFVRRF